MSFSLRLCGSLASLASIIHATGAVASPQTLGTGLEILLHNDLYGNETSRKDAVIVLETPMTQSEALAACEELSETLWTPSVAHFHSGEDSFLKYLPFKDTVGPYWIGGPKGKNCPTTTAEGVQSEEACSSKLPAFCSQTAPVSNMYHQNNATTWQTQVKAGNQWITGFRDQNAFRFEGIRYAQQPERFTYSTIYEGTGNTTALSFGSECVQAGNVGSEDCLFLNVWTPRLPSNSTPGASNLRAVLFWIHGGGFSSGTGSDPTFDGGALAARGDVVVVTINYRLTTLGFLALNNSLTHGNYGLADQITALQWVRQYIRSFGGDPSRTTIFGQSAGAGSVRALLASPATTGLFSAAIMQSNLAGLSYASTYSHYYTIAQEAALVAPSILNDTGCASAASHLDCLRAVSPHTQANLGTTAAYLVVDGTYLTTDTLELSGAGPAAPVPVLMGYMRDDGAAFIPYPSAGESQAAFVAASGFNVSGTTLASQFPLPTAANQTLDVFNATALLATDAEFRCLDEATAAAAARNAVFPELYFYEFNRSYQLAGYSPNYPLCQAPVLPAYPLGDPRAEYFKCHSDELYFVFGSLAYNALKPRDQDDVPFMQFVLDFWAALARRHDPNPDPRFLQARGFANTSMELARQGRWAAVEPDSHNQRLLQWPSVETTFAANRAGCQCAALGLDISYYYNPPIAGETSAGSTGDGPGCPGDE